MVLAVLVWLYMFAHRHQRVHAVQAVQKLDLDLRIQENPLVVYHQGLLLCRGLDAEKTLAEVQARPCATSA